MLVRTKFFGELEVAEDGVFHFEKGIPGFQNLDKYIVLKEDNSAFDYLQSTEEDEVCFIIIDPFQVVENYEFEISDATVKKLSIEKVEDVVVYSIITIGAEAKDITVNLKAPIILNMNNKSGVQEIIDNEEYNTRHQLVKETDK